MAVSILKIADKTQKLTKDDVLSELRRTIRKDKEIYLNHSPHHYSADREAALKYAMHLVKRIG